MLPVPLPLVESSSPVRGPQTAADLALGPRHTQNRVNSFGAGKDISLPVMALPGRLHQPIQIVTGMSGFRRRPALSLMLGQQRLTHAGLQTVLLEAAKIENSLDTCQPNSETPGAASLSTSHEDLLQLACYSNHSGAAENPLRTAGNKLALPGSADGIDTSG